MKLFKQVIFVILWSVLFGLTTPLLIVAFLAALARGRQGQHFVQKPIFDGGDQTAFKSGDSLFY